MNSKKKFNIFSSIRNKLVPEKQIYTETLKETIYKIVKYAQTLEKEIATKFDTELPKAKENVSSDSTNDGEETEQTTSIRDISIYDFVDFILEKLEFEPTHIVLALMILDKALKKHFILTSRNVHKFIMVLLMVTQKVFGDVPFKSACFAKVLNVSPEELLELELEFMDLLEFNLYINNDDFEPYKTKIKKYWEQNRQDFGFFKERK